MAERHALAVTNASLHGSCLSFSAGLLDHLRVELYGDHMPMKACGTATVRDPQLLVFNAFDPSVGEAQSVPGIAVKVCGRQTWSVASDSRTFRPATTSLSAHQWRPALSIHRAQTSETIAKAIRDSPLGLNPRVEGQDILVPVPR